MRGRVAAAGRRFGMNDIAAGRMCIRLVYFMGAWTCHIPPFAGVLALGVCRAQRCVLRMIIFTLKCWPVPPPHLFLTSSSGLMTVIC